ncbi:XRE family transcriptional regulator [Rhodanobacter glycinis]|nr:XRE family transcriptional regulator [Rhodanobacter glycinis]
MGDMHARIREARSRVGVSQEEFAARLGVSRGAVAQWEMEKGTSPSVKNLEQVAIHSGFAFEWLATGRGPRVFGEPMIKEPTATYGVALSVDEHLVVAAMRRMEPARRSGLVSLLAPPK